MKTDVDTCLREIADWYVRNKRSITEPELEAILLKHCEDEAERLRFVRFLETEPGQLRFKTLLRERKPVKELWEMTLEQYALEKGARPAWVKAGYGETYRTHKRAVERAISEGKPVSAEVLADYPHLLKEKRSEFWLGIAGAEKKFPLGQIVMTRGVNDLVAENTEFAKFVTESFRRHARGDWGDLSEEDKRENEYALGKYLRLFSAYVKPPLRKIWIITEADRSVTTILFPEEY